jgi:exopolysaccharide biosynthesis polyprenyl glycosylphosphotransferase
MSMPAATVQSGFSVRKPRQLYLSPWQFMALLQVMDLFTAALFTLVLLRSTQHLVSKGALLTFELPLVVVVLILDQCIRLAWGLYRVGMAKRPYTTAIRAGLAWFFAATPIVMMMTPQRSPAFGVNVVLFFGISIAAFAVLHYTAVFVASFLERIGVLGQRIAVIGESAAVAACIERINHHSSGKHICAVISEGEWPLSELALRARVERLSHARPDIVILTMSLLDLTQVTSLVNHFRSLPARVLLAPWVRAADGGTVLPGKSEALSVGMALIEIAERPIQGWRWVLKDMQDRFLAVVLLLFMLPVLIFVAVRIRLTSPGPILFRQMRRGYCGTYFDILKFRTMSVGASTLAAEDLKLTIRNDPRVYPFGRFLRRTSLDELPQLFNVLRGDMWLVGPRPHSPLAKVGDDDYATVVPDYAARYRIKPGVTGWAQVNGWRGPTDTIEQIAKRVEYDLYYIENLSVRLDFVILLRTLACLWPHKNAF